MPHRGQASTTRRAAIASAVAACLPMGAAAGRAPEPAVAAAIAAHRSAVAALADAARYLCDVEEGLVDDEGQDRGSGADDDPLLQGAIVAFDAACKAETRAAWLLTRMRPAAPAAAAVLLRYVGDVEAAGHAWPEPSGGRNWMAAFHHRLAAALDAMA